MDGMAMTSSATTVPSTVRIARRFDIGAICFAAFAGVISAPIVARLRRDSRRSAEETQDGRARA